MIVIDQESPWLQPGSTGYDLYHGILLPSLPLVHPNSLSRCPASDRYSSESCPETFCRFPFSANAKIPGLGGITLVTSGFSMQAPNHSLVQVPIHRGPLQETARQQCRSSSEGCRLLPAASVSASHVEFWEHVAFVGVAMSVLTTHDPNQAFL